MVGVPSYLSGLNPPPVGGQRFGGVCPGFCCDANCWAEFCLLRKSAKCAPSQTTDIMVVVHGGCNEKAVPEGDNCSRQPLLSKPCICYIAVWTNVDQQILPEKSWNNPPPPWRWICYEPQVLSTPLLILSKKKNAAMAAFTRLFKNPSVFLPLRCVFCWFFLLLNVN